MSSYYGPQTDEGKARSAQNSLKTGLFAKGDFIRPSEQEEYDELQASFLTDLQPEGGIEEAFTAEIVGATWRLHRCRVLEADFCFRTVLDPMVDEVIGHEQKSIDRARTQSHNLMRRSMAELRKLQTERTLRMNLNFESR